MLKLFSQYPCRIALQAKNNLTDREMLWAVKKQMKVIGFDRKMDNLHIDLSCFFPQQDDQAFGYLTDKHLTTPSRYPNDVIPN